MSCKPDGTHHHACDCREEQFKRLVGYVMHDRDCILSHWEAGESTDDGGYRSMYRNKWYQTRPVDETPKCTCGLDKLLSDTGLK